MRSNQLSYAPRYADEYSKAIGAMQGLCDDAALPSAHQPRAIMVAPWSTPGGSSAGAVVHSSQESTSATFGYLVDGRTADFATVFRDFGARDRLGIAARRTARAARARR